MAGIGALAGAGSHGGKQQAGRLLAGFLWAPCPREPCGTAEGTAVSHRLLGALPCPVGACVRSSLVAPGHGSGAFVTAEQGAVPEVEVICFGD